jgi:hypothetical protein
MTYTPVITTILVSPRHVVYPGNSLRQRIVQIKHFYPQKYLEVDNLL